MGSGGHNKRPTKLKLAEGTANSTRILTDEFEPTLLTYVPDAPDELSDGAKKVWAIVAQELLDAGILYSIDLDLLKRYCTAWMYQKDCEKSIRDNGIVIDTVQGSKANPAVVQWHSFEKDLLNIGANLGIGPANRTKIGGHKKPNEGSLSSILKAKPKIDEKRF